MPCPVAECDGQITFNTLQLLHGQEYSCPKCNSVISLSQQRNKVVEDTMEEFEAMRERLSKNSEKK
jgi:transcription initiation factor IIE alpha subunit